MTTTIQIETKVREELTALKLHHRETYNDIIKRLLEDTHQLSKETKQHLKLALADARAGRVTSHERVGKELGF